MKWIDIGHYGETLLCLAVFLMRNVEKQCFQFAEVRLWFGRFRIVQYDSSLRSSQYGKETHPKNSDVL